MQIPIQVHFVHMKSSAAIEEVVLREASQLENYFSRIIACRVTVDDAHHHQQKGRLFSIRIDLTIPGDEIVVNHEHHLSHAHEDPYVAIHEAFSAALRGLQNYLHKREDSRKSHSPSESRQP